MGNFTGDTRLRWVMEEAVDIEAIRTRIREMAENSRREGDPLAWFEEIYSESCRNAELIPWADLQPNPLMMEWVNEHKSDGQFLVNKRALIVGCGLGDDAVGLAELGMEVVAFDLSETCIEWCKERFPKTDVKWLVADLAKLPDEWKNNFDLVVEIHILQAVQREVRDELASQLPPLLSSGGELLCIGRRRPERANEPIDEPGPPWPLKRSWLELCFPDLTLLEYKDAPDEVELDAIRYRAWFRNS